MNRINKNINYDDFVADKKEQQALMSSKAGK